MESEIQHSASMEAPMVLIRVSQDTWLVPRLILCHRSVRFQTMLERLGNQPDKPQLDFSEVQDNVKDSFYSWIHHGKLRDDGLDPNSKDDCDTRFASLMNLAVVADRYKIPELSNLAIDYLHNFFTEARSLPKLAQASTFALRLRRGSKTYVFLVEVFARRQDISHHDYFSADVAASFARHILLRLSELLVKHQGCSADSVLFQKENLCKFHQFPHCGQLKPQVLQLLRPGAQPPTPPSVSVLPNLPDTLYPPIPQRPPPPTPPPEPEWLHRNDSVLANPSHVTKLSDGSTVSETRSTPKVSEERPRSPVPQIMETLVQSPCALLGPPPQKSALRSATSNPTMRGIPPQQPPPLKPLPPTPTSSNDHSPSLPLAQVNSDGRPKTSPSESTSQDPPQLMPLPRISRLDKTLQWTWMPPLEPDPPARSQTFPTLPKSLPSAKRSTPPPLAPPPVPPTIPSAVRERSATMTALPPMPPDEPPPALPPTSPAAKKFRIIRTRLESLNAPGASSSTGETSRKRSDTVRFPDVRTFDPELLVVPANNNSHRSSASIDVVNAWFEEEMHSEKLESNPKQGNEVEAPDAKSSRAKLPLRTIRQMRQIRCRRSVLMARLNWNKS